VQLRRVPVTAVAAEHHRSQTANYGSLPWPWRATRAGNFPLFHSSRQGFYTPAAGEALYRRRSRRGAGRRDVSPAARATVPLTT
jgi:hypothetical protein